MNQDQPELTLEESIKQVMQTLPPIIRDYLTQGKYTAVAKDMMAKYSLRIDQGGVLEREIMLLLMGIENPDEFSKSLAEEAKLEQKTINGIVQDINEQIFVPLREQMRREAPTAPEAAKPAPPEQPRTFFHLENKIPLPRQNRPAEGKLPQVPVPASPVSPKPALRDVLATVMETVSGGSQIPAEPRKLLEDHEEPHIEFRNKARAAAPLAQPAPPKPLTSYSTDPYREPIDEK